MGMWLRHVAAALSLVRGLFRPAGSLGRPAKQTARRNRHYFEVPEASPSLVEIEAVYRSRGADFFRLALAKTRRLGSIPTQPDSRVLGDDRDDSVFEENRLRLREAAGEERELGPSAFPL